MKSWTRYIVLGWSVILCVSLGCGDDDEGIRLNQSENGNNQVEPSELEPEEACEMACDKIYANTVDGGCQQVFQHDNGAAMNEETCVELCLHEDLMRSGEACVATEVECQSQPSEMVDACLPQEYHSPACDHLGAWDHDWVEMEEEVVELVNELRDEGVTCPSTGSVMPPAAPLEMDEELRCASRLHSKDMHDNGFFAHDNLDGESPFQRMENANYSGSPAGENIAMGQGSAESVVNSWYNSDTGHCENMLEGGHNDIGVGYYSSYWTQKFGR